MRQKNLKSTGDQVKISFTNKEDDSNTSMVIRWLEIWREILCGDEVRKPS